VNQEKHNKALHRSCGRRVFCFSSFHRPQPGERHRYVARQEMHNLGESPPIRMILTMSIFIAVFGCDTKVDSDVIGPKTTAFKPGVSFELSTLVSSADPNTKSFKTPFHGYESVFLHQTPIATERDIDSVTMNEAPGQWAFAVVSMRHDTLDRINEITRTKDVTLAVVLEGEVVCVTDLKKGEVCDHLTISESFDIPDIRSYVK
jgi:hypothetical protein